MFRCIFQRIFRRIFRMFQDTFRPRKPRNYWSAIIYHIAMCRRGSPRHIAMNWVGNPVLHRQMHSGQSGAICRVGNPMLYAEWAIRCYICRVVNPVPYRYMQNGQFGDILLCAEWVIRWHVQNGQFGDISLWTVCAIMRTMRTMRYAYFIVLYWKAHSISLAICIEICTKEN